MGRESRSNALKADNRGNRLRKLWAKNEALYLLAGDLRVQAECEQWVRVQDQRGDEGPPAWVTSDADFKRAVAEAQQADIDRLAAVLQQMGVPWDWCAPVLVAITFPAMRYNAAHPDDPRGVESRIGLVGIPKGQAPPHDGTSIEQNVGWWYRAKIKHPTDSISRLAEEYATRENRVTDCRSVVQIGIERAEVLLDGRFARWADS